MADGSRDYQRGFGFPAPQTSALRPGEIVVDLFAGGGGASEALKQALGVDPALAYNHDADAIGMHAANHPLTDHHREDIWHADPVRDVANRAVGWFHASPDCTHFSQAKGGQPRSKATRSLSWVVLKWAGSLAKAGHAPRIISLENVVQILTWGPLIAKRDKATGRVIKLDGTIAAPGERVSVWEQSLVPDKRHAGRTWSHFVAALRRLGYAVEWRQLIASDYGAGTSRKRLFLLARRDGDPIRWPEPTHGPGRAHPYVTAADCIDFSDRGRSIFDRPRPLADATMRRIARGVMRHVLQSADPFIVPATHHGSDRVNDVREPMRTITAANRGELMLLSPVMVQASHGEGKPGGVQRWGDGSKDVRLPAGTITASGSGGQAVATAALVPALVQTGYGERAGQQPRCPNIHAPLGTVVAGGVKHALVSAFLEQANGGFYAGTGRDLRHPMSTITATGSQQQLVTTDLAELSPEAEAGALRVAAFLINYYGNGTALDLRDPLDTVTTRDRMALVTVTIQGTPYVIVDIALRMLRPPELYRAQGFPPDYIIDRTADGRPLTISAQVRMVGNSVSRQPLQALARANLDPALERLRMAA